MQTEFVKRAYQHVQVNGLANNPLGYCDPQSHLFDTANTLLLEMGDLLAQKVIDNLMSQQLGVAPMWASFDGREAKIMDLLQEVCDLIGDIQVAPDGEYEEVKLCSNKPINVLIQKGNIRYVD